METKTHGQFDARYSDFSYNSHLNSLKNNTPKFSKCRSSLRMPVSNSSPCGIFRFLIPDDAVDRRKVGFLTFNFNSS